MAQQDHDTSYVLFSAGRDPQPPTRSANFTRRELPLNDRQLSLLWQRLRLPLPVELVTGRVDLVHSPDFVLPPVAHAKTVLTIHDLSFMRYPECSSPPLLKYLLDAVPRSVARADCLLADSESTRQDLIELMHVPPERVFVVYAGVEDRFWATADTEQEAQTPARYGLDRPYILSVGTLQPRKNYPRLIRAYAQLRLEHHIPHQLVISGGRGWLYEEIDATIRELGLMDQVRLMGFVGDDDLPALYRGASVFAFPSLYEGFGIPMLEAMCCGTPVVTSTASSLPEVAGDAALTVNPHDVAAIAEALWRALDDETLRNELRQRGYERARCFTWAGAAQSLRDVYAKVLRGEVA